MVFQESEFDGFADHYSEHVGRAIEFSGKDHAFYLRAKAAHLGEALRRRGARAGDCRLLDVGCGSGLFHRHLRTFKSVTGVDESAAMLVRARVDNPMVGYVRSDALRLPLAGEQFDVVLAVNVFHHMMPQHRPALIREMVRVCRAGGFVAVIEHNPLNPLTRYVTSRCPCDRGVHLVGRAEATRLLDADGGLEAVEVGYLLFVPSERRLVRRFEWAVRAVPVGAQYCAIGRRPHC